MRAPDFLSLGGRGAWPAADAADLAHQVEGLREVLRRKEEFLGLLAHELRGPLAGLLTAAEVLRRPGIPAEALARSAGIVERQGRLLAGLLGDLQDWARLQRGDILPGNERLDLAALARAALDRGPPDSEAGRPALDLVPPCGPVWVWGDAGRLAQALRTLLEHALQSAGPRGRVTVRVSRAAADGRAQLSVTDSGAGVEPEQLPRFFDPFAAEGGPRGLGLALARGLIELQGGEVRAFSAGRGCGTEVRLWLPLHEPAPAAAARRGPAPARPAAALRVLIVDDERDTADSLGLLLGRAGHEVRAVYSGAAALEAARLLRPDVVLCDLGLPGVPGLEVGRALRADPATAGARLIAVSGYGQEEDVRRSLEAGFDLHLAKPVDPDAWPRLLAGR
jgi:CheY-like chemotaxis protein